MPYFWRRSTRIPGFDYTTPGVYFITICTRRRRCIFGDVIDAEMQLSRIGEIVLATWNELPAHFDNVETDAFTILPNHVHGNIALRRGTACRAPTLTTGERFGKPVVGSIPTIVRSFKSAVTKRINEMTGTPGGKLWQRGYDEHIVRGTQELDRIRRYIENNPRNWYRDVENPCRRSR
jgi:REP element-mobilizing transposase RayT